MPQIGWFEILIIVFVAIILIGPKDFPMVLKKIGSWIGTAKRYVQNVQQQVSNLNEEEISLNDNNIKTEKKDEDKKSK